MRFDQKKKKKNKKDNCSKPPQLQNHCIITPKNFVKLQITPLNFDYFLLLSPVILPIEALYIKWKYTSLLSLLFIPKENDSIYLSIPCSQPLESFHFQMKDHFFLFSSHFIYHSLSCRRKPWVDSYNSINLSHSDRGCVQKKNVQGKPQHDYNMAVASPWRNKIHSFGSDGKRPRNMCWRHRLSIQLLDNERTIFYFCQAKLAVFQNVQAIAHHMNHISIFYKIKHEE